MLAFSNKGSLVVFWSKWLDSWFSFSLETSGELAVRAELVFIFLIKQSFFVCKFFNQQLSPDNSSFSYWNWHKSIFSKYFTELSTRFKLPRFAIYGELHCCKHFLRKSSCINTVQGSHCRCNGSFLWVHWLQLHSQILRETDFAPTGFEFL